MFTLQMFMILLWGYTVLYMYIIMYDIGLGLGRIGGSYVVFFCDVGSTFTISTFY